MLRVACKLDSSAAAPKCQRKGLYAARAAKRPSTWPRSAVRGSKSLMNALRTAGRGRRTATLIARTPRGLSALRQDRLRERWCTRHRRGDRRPARGGRGRGRGQRSGRRRAGSSISSSPTTGPIATPRCDGSSRIDRCRWASASQRTWRTPSSFWHRRSPGSSPAPRSTSAGRFAGWFDLGRQRERAVSQWT